MWRLQLEQYYERKQIESMYKQRTRRKRLTHRKAFCLSVFSFCRERTVLHSCVCCSPHAAVWTIRACFHCLLLDDALQGPPKPSPYIRRILLLFQSLQLRSNHTVSASLVLASTLRVCRAGHMAIESVVVNAWRSLKKYMASTILSHTARACYPRFRRSPYTRSLDMGKSHTTMG